MVAVYCEGPTEWYIIYQLVKRNILHGNLIGDRDNIRPWIVKPNDITKDLLDNLPNDLDRILLVFDQEQEDFPDDIRNKINCSGLNFNTIDEYPNVFIGFYRDKRVALFVANGTSPDGNKDFDGYIVQLVERLGTKTVKLWFEDATNGRDDDRLPGYLRNLRSGNSTKYEIVHSLGFTDIPNTMKEKNWPIQRSKTQLYAYITALQLNKSSVWFSEKLVKWAPEEVLKTTFASLIKAWEFLVEGNE